MTLHVDEFVREFRSWAEDVVDEAVVDMAGQLHDKVPVGRTTPLGRPRLRDTQHYEVRGLVGMIEYRAPHASYSEEGTDPHPITGNPLLAFYWEKMHVFVIVHSVNHPGNAPQHWWSDIMNERNWVDTLERAMSRTQF